MPRILPDTGTNRLSFLPYLDAEEFSRGYVRGVNIVKQKDYMYNIAKGLWRDFDILNIAERELLMLAALPISL